MAQTSLELLHEAQTDLELKIFLPQPPKRLGLQTYAYQAWPL